MIKGSRRKGSSPALNEAESRPSRGKAKYALTAPVIMLTIIVAAAVFVNFNTLFNGFVYDDNAQIVQNPWIRDLHSIFRIFTSNVWSFAEETAVSNYYRPLMHTIYIMNYHIFGLSPWGFHLVNILFHAANSALLFLIASRLLNIMEKGRDTLPLRDSRFTIHDSRFFAFLAALLFATHPIHTEAVAWIAGVPELSFTLFYLLSLYFYMKYREGAKGGYSISVLCFALATLCKEPALTLPAVLMAYDYSFRQEGDRLADRLTAYIPYISVSAVYLAMRMYALGGFAPQEPHVVLSAYGYFINVFPLFAGYIEKLILPVDLNAFHVFHPVSSLLEVKGALSLAFTIVFVAFSLLSVRRHRVLFFGSVLILIPLLPALYIPALGENVFAERYLYLPSFGLMILVASGLARAKTVLTSRSIALYAIILLAVGLYSAGTIGRNTVWRDDYTLFTDILQKSPEADMIHYDLGNYYIKQGNLDEAGWEYQRAIGINPNYDRSHNNLGNIYKAFGKIDEAVAEYETAVRINPNNAEAYNNLGVGYIYQGRNNDAITAFKAALTLNPAYLTARRNMEVVLNKSKKEGIPSPR